MSEGRDVVMYARVYRGKRLHIVTGPHAHVYVAACGYTPGNDGKGWPSPGWYKAHAQLSPYYPVCKACEAAGPATPPGARAEGSE